MAWLHLLFTQVISRLEQTFLQKALFYHLLTVSLFEWVQEIILWQAKVLS